MYLLNSAGRVNEKITLEDRESLIINTNYAMNTAKFSYNPKRHSLLYLTRKDDFIVEAVSYTHLTLPTTERV